MHQVSGSSMGSSGLTQNSFPCPPPTQATKRHVPITYNIYFTLLMCLFFSQPLQGQGQHYWVPYGRQHTTNPVNFAVVRCQDLQEFTSFKKFTQRTRAAHAMLSPAAPWQGARETAEKSKWDSSYSDRITLQSLNCHLHLLSKVQGKNNIRLHLVISLAPHHVDKLFHVDKWFKKSFPASQLHTPALRALAAGIGTGLLWCRIYTAPGTWQCRGLQWHRAEVRSHTLTHSDAHGIQLLMGGRVGCLFRVTSHHGDKTQWMKVTAL